MTDPLPVPEFTYPATEGLGDFDPDTVPELGELEHGDAECTE